jgi:antitoxin component HigA of HigAB toxin-antitoxin module
MTKLIINCETGEIVKRELNADELQQQAIDQAKADAYETEAQAKAEAKAVAQAKLEALGLTVDDLTALGL